MREAVLRQTHGATRRGDGQKKIFFVMFEASVKLVRQPI
jgi:hypothetical protein